jgi:hypothetical protein
MGDNFALKHHTVRRNISDSKDDKNAQEAHFSWTHGAGPGGTAGAGD